jgi:hypothetical protein
MEEQGQEIWDLRLQDVADRQLRNEQRYFDSLDSIFARLEVISKQQEERFLSYEYQLSKQAELIRLRDISIEQLQLEISQQNLALLTAQADLISLKNSRPRAKLKKALERFGFLITPLIPISFLRHSKRLARRLLKT